MHNTLLTNNLAGGQAYQRTSDLSLFSWAATSFVQPTYYQDVQGQQNMVRDLVADCDPQWVAACAVYVRRELGMRSSSHTLAALLAPHASGQPWARNFYRDIVRRLDDIPAIISTYQQLQSSADQVSYGLASWHGAVQQRHLLPLPRAMVRGFADALAAATPYEIAKYQAGKNGWKLRDCVRLLHPQPTVDNETAYQQLIAGTLRRADTWEDQISAVGPNGDKTAAWDNLVGQDNLGQMALLMNLRNLAQHASDEMFAVACARVSDETRVRQSLLLPFRYQAAQAALLQADIDNRRRQQTLQAIHAGADVALGNLPSLDGDTLVVLDTSASMYGKPIQIGALFAAALVRAHAADFMQFSTNAQYERLDDQTSLLHLAEDIADRAHCGGTNFRAIFEQANRAYDRVIILSDMQGWIGYTTPQAEFQAYCQRTGARPHVYSFDLTGSTTSQLIGPNIHAVAGWSDTILRTIGALETSPQALRDQVAASLA